MAALRVANRTPEQIERNRQRQQRYDVKRYAVEQQQRREARRAREAEAARLEDAAARAAQEAERERRAQLRQDAAAALELSRINADLYREPGRRMRAERTQQERASRDARQPSHIPLPPVVVVDEPKSARVGVWRFGPVVRDWSGISSVVRCDACPTYGVLFLDHEAGRLEAVEHAKVMHGLALGLHLGEPVRAVAA